MCSNNSFNLKDGGVCQTPNRPYMTAEHTSGKFIIFQPRCKMWSCPACAIINRDNWSFRAKDAARILIENGYHLHFLTLTSHPKLDAKQSEWVFTRAWKKLSERARYDTDRKFIYLMIPERHKSGKLHTHAIETSGLGMQWWKDSSAECGLGYMAEEKQIQDVDNTVAYVIKYLNKGMGTAGKQWPKGFRRVRTSQSWPKPLPMPNADGWTFNLIGRGERIDNITEKARVAGRDVAICDHLTAWDIVGDVDNDDI